MNMGCALYTGKYCMLFVSCLRSDGWLTTEGENGQAWDYVTLELPV